MTVETVREFRSKWAECRECHLGAQRNTRTIFNMERVQVVPKPVFGRTTENWTQGEGVLFVGDPVDNTDECTGVPFSHPRYAPIHQILGLRPDIPFALTHMLLCRACVPVRESNGTIQIDRYGLGRYRTVEPDKSSMDACRKRLHEEIYLLDPLIIVALGLQALRALNPRVAAPLTGTFYDVPVQGLTSVPVRTAAGRWERKVRGQIVRPSAPRTVRYIALFTVGVRDLEQFGASEDPDREASVFARDMKAVVKLWDFYQSVKKEPPHGTQTDQQ